MAQEDVLRWARTIEDLQHRLDLDVRTEHLRSAALLELEQARTAAVRATMELHDGLWGGRQREWVASLEQARRSAERGWWESPALWFAIGLIVATGVAVGLLVAVNH